MRPFLLFFVGAAMATLSDHLHAIERLSVPQAGGEGNSLSQALDFTPDGRYVLIYSFSSNFVTGDNNSLADLFRIDRDDGSIVRVSVNTAGAESTDESPTTKASISDSGNLVCFVSESSELVAGDNNGAGDVFLRDIGGNTTTRVSLTSGDGEVAGGVDISSEVAISGNGTAVVFQSSDPNVVVGDMNGVSDIFLRQLGMSGTTIRVSISDGEMEASGASSEASISDDGNLVCFVSNAEDLIQDDDNGQADVFVRDLSAAMGGSTTRVSLTSAGNQQENGGSDEAVISSDGSTVAFTSYANNLLPGDTNSLENIFVRSLTANTTEVITAPSGSSTFVANGQVASPTISPSGRFVGFLSSSTQLFPGTSPSFFHGYLRDRQTRTTQFVNLTESGQIGTVNGSTSTSRAGRPSIIDSGTFVFNTNADDLVSNDNNDWPDVFLAEFIPYVAPPVATLPDNSLLIASLTKKLKKLKAKQKKAKRAKKVALAKKFKKKIKKLKQQIAAL